MTTVAVLMIRDQVAVAAAIDLTATTLARVSPGRRMSPCQSTGNVARLASPGLGEALGLQRLLRLVANAVRPGAQPASDSAAHISAVRRV